MSLQNLYHQVENRIATALIDAALAKGYSIVINDGEEDHPKSNDRKTILDSMASTDQEYVVVYEGDRRIGMIWIIYGEGATCITDYSDCPEIEVLVNKAMEGIDV